MKLVVLFLRTFCELDNFSFNRDLHFNKEITEHQAVKEQLFALRHEHRILKERNEHRVIKMVKLYHIKVVNFHLDNYSDESYF